MSDMEPGGDERSPALIKTLGGRAAAVRAAVVPDWLAEVVRPKPAPLPWPAMIRAALAICVPLSVAFGLGKPTLGILPAMGAILGTMTDTGGTYRQRVKRVSSAAVFGGAVGLAIGSAIHGRGWIAVVALVVVAGASGLLTTIGEIGSVTGLQLLVYAALGIGPVGALRPVWHTALGFLAGVAWALVLLLPSWLVSPHGQEQRAVAAVYRALADGLSSIGTSQVAAKRQAVTAALNTAYDSVLRARSLATGRSPATTRLVAALNASHPMAEAGSALVVAGTRPPPMVIATVERLADSAENGTRPPVIPPAWSYSPGALALRDAMAAAARVLAPEWTAEQAGRDRLLDRIPDRHVFGRIGRRLSRLLARMGDDLEVGTLARRFTIRLMACIGVAAVASEVLPVQRSYWVLLTVAIVFKPDYGSVFARALQRGIGTIVGAVAGAVLLVLVHGTWLLIPLTVLAALLPYGRSRNYGLLATFLTPLVVVLIDLLSPIGWRLATDRLIDTLIGCAIVLIVGFAPWPMSWYSHLPARFAQAALDVCQYMEQALCAPAEPGADGTAPTADSRLRRSTYRALSDLRAEFQRTLSEPRAISRRAASWWPAVVGLEQVMQAVTATALAARRGVSVPEDGVRELSGVLRAIGAAAANGTAVPQVGKLPADETLKPVTEAIQALLGVLNGGDRLSAKS
jgi:uncharacterized membrane protein YccC